MKDEEYVVKLSPRAESRYKQIIPIALDVIVHHGYERVTMEDVAKACGISRVALYRYFNNKEDLLCAIVNSLNEDMNSSARSAIQEEIPFSERLYKALDIRLGKTQRLLIKGSYGHEISDATHRVTGEITKRYDLEYIAIIGELFRSSRDSGEIDTGPTGLTPDEYAELCVFSAKGLMKGPGDVVFVEDYDDALKRLVLVISESLKTKV